VSHQATPIFLRVEKSKVIPKVCLASKNGEHLTDLEIVTELIHIINEIDKDRLNLISQVKDIEQHLLSKYGEIYDPV